MEIILIASNYVSFEKKYPKIDDNDKACDLSHNTLCLLIVASHNDNNLIRVIKYNVINNHTLQVQQK